MATLRNVVVTVTGDVDGVPYEKKYAVKDGTYQWSMERDCKYEYDSATGKPTDVIVSPWFTFHISGVMYHPQEPYPS